MTRLVLLTLSLHMTVDGDRAFPSGRKLAEETGLSERAVSSHLSRAVQAGWVARKRVRLPGKQWAQYFYQACIPKTIAARNSTAAAAAGRPDSGSRRLESQRSNHQNDVPVNTAENTAKNTTRETTVSAASRKKRHDDCVAFLANIGRRSRTSSAVRPNEFGDEHTRVPSEPAAEAPSAFVSATDSDATAQSVDLR